MTATTYDWRAAEHPCGAAAHETEQVEAPKWIHMAHSAGGKATQGLRQAKETKDKNLPRISLMTTRDSFGLENLL